MGVQGELDKEWDRWKTDQQQSRQERDQRFSESRCAKEQLIAEARQLIGSHRDPEARRRAKDLFQEWRQIKSAGKVDDDSLWKDFRETLDEFYEQGKADQRRHILAEIEKIEEMIERAKSNREANEERIANARSTEYADRVREWIEEDDSKLQRFTDWLDEWQEKLNRLDD